MILKPRTPCNEKRIPERVVWTVVCARRTRDDVMFVNLTSPARLTRITMLDGAHAHRAAATSQYIDGTIRMCITTWGPITSHEFRFTHSIVVLRLSSDRSHGNH